jgi:hypothetical protein
VAYPVIQAQLVVSSLGILYYREVTSPEPVCTCSTVYRQLSCWDFGPQPTASHDSKGFLFRQTLLHFAAGIAILGQAALR